MHAPCMLDRRLIQCHSTVPTKDQVLVPETLLKKRKSQEKARAEKQAEIENKKKVSCHCFCSLPGDDVMHTIASD